MSIMQRMNSYDDDYADYEYDYAAEFLLRDELAADRDAAAVFWR